MANINKIIINKDLCIGCGLCVNICPEVFELGEDGKSTVKKNDSSGCDIKQAVADCPVGAISYE